MNQNVERTIAAKMAAAGISRPAVDAFLYSVQQLAKYTTTCVPEDTLEPVLEAELPRLQELKRGRTPPDSALAEQLAVVKLNGGLGTSMGLERAKSLLPARGQDTFLDLAAKQILHLRQQLFRQRNAAWPAFYLMNSLGTQQDTLRHMSQYPEFGGSAGPLDFLQNWVPKIDPHTLQPVVWPAQPDLEWCPPGHGDLYPALSGSGLLDELLVRGVKFLFVSNSDNAAAAVDLDLLHYLADSGLSFVMEVAERTPVDRKGGHLARRRSDGRWVLRESSQVSPEDQLTFQNTARHRFFNTNNLWLRLDHLKDLLENHGGVIPLPVIRNVKTVDPVDVHSPLVFQLESACGAAIECFERAGAVVVPRLRFSPVKTTSDLLAMWSDAYRLTDDFRVTLAESRNGQPLTVDLDARYYRLWPDFQARFTDGVPSLLECDSLKVIGDVRFARDVICRGDVEFVNSSREVRTVPAGTYCDVRHAL